MEYLFKERLAWVWVGLSLVTWLSWQLGGGGNSKFEPNFAISAAVMIFAVVKARFVLRSFMEVRHASKWLRRGTDAWIVLLPAAMWLVYSV